MSLDKLHTPTEDDSSLIILPNDAVRTTVEAVNSLRESLSNGSISPDEVRAILAEHEQSVNDAADLTNADTLNRARAELASSLQELTAEDNHLPSFSTVLMQLESFAHTHGLQVTTEEPGKTSTGLPDERFRKAAGNTESVFFKCALKRPKEGRPDRMVHGEVCVRVFPGFLDVKVYDGGEYWRSPVQGLDFSNSTHDAIKRMLENVEGTDAQIH